MRVHSLTALLASLGVACAAPDPAPSETSPMPSDTRPDDACTVLFDFSDPADRAAWRAENDTVMGGNSQGRVAEAEDALVFAGDLVTRDGGFVQMSARLPEGAMAGMASLRVVGTSEGRPWRARVTTTERVDRADMRGGEEGDAPIARSGQGMDGPRVSFAAPIEGLGREEAAIGTAAFSRPEPSVRGRPVPNAPFAPADATTLGLILSDGRDAPFRLEVSRIEVCR